MPELTDDLIATFRHVTAAEHARFASGEVRPRGRPRKPENEKEQPHSIRFSPDFLARLKSRALSMGYRQWQSYVKRLLLADIEGELGRPEAG